MNLLSVVAATLGGFVLAEGVHLLNLHLELRDAERRSPPELPRVLLDPGSITPVPEPPTMDLPPLEAEIDLDLRPGQTVVP